MVFVVERYLPGLDREMLLRSLGGLEQVASQMRDEGTPVRYLGSTIVPEDESCFCQFEASDQAAVAEANQRAAVPFHRIVSAVAIALPDQGDGRRL
jgi:uncharacterized protein DUF4242